MVDSDPGPGRQRADRLTMTNSRAVQRLRGFVGGSRVLAPGRVAGVEVRARRYLTGFRLAWP